MTNFNCFCVPAGRKKKVTESSDTADGIKTPNTLQVRLELPVKSSEPDGLEPNSSVAASSLIQVNSLCKVKGETHGSPTGGRVEGLPYKAEDENDDTLSVNRNAPDFNFQVHAGNPCEETHNDQLITKIMTKDMYVSSAFGIKINDQFQGKTDKDKEHVFIINKSGHLSDPGIQKAEFWASPKLSRSCSDLGTREMLMKIADQLPQSQSFEEMQILVEKGRVEVLPGSGVSPVSVITHCSADKVMLKKHSSSQILPSRSRRLWWKLFLWSHRNLHKPWTANPESLSVRRSFIEQGGGYSSDTLELRRGKDLSNLASPSSFIVQPLIKENNNDNHQRDGFHGTVSGFWPQNQWVAFSSESSRVDEWVKEHSTQSSLPLGGDLPDEEVDYPPSPDNGKSKPGTTSHLSQHPYLNLPEEIVHANSIIQSLNSSSTVAHIAGIGLKVIPSMSSFSRLRSVNLSGNFIVHIMPGSLPPVLHILNLARNKIIAIEGLRELTRLRVLNLSYNRISRFGQGLSNCTLLKELYLTGNKIRDVEGLHRLLKLTILDLSFNKLSTTKAIGQLMANYNSLLALNLMGNPIQSNISDNQLRKAICSLLPKLSYLNKQPINPHKARELGPGTIAKVALSNNTRSEAVKRASHGGSSSSTVHRRSAGVAHKGRHKSNGQTQNYFQRIN